MELNCYTVSKIPELSCCTNPTEVSVVGCTIIPYTILKVQPKLANNLDSTDLAELYGYTAAAITDSIQICSTTCYDQYGHPLGTCNVSDQSIIGSSITGCDTRYKYEGGDNVLVWAYNYVLSGVEDDPSIPYTCLARYSDVSGKTFSYTYFSGYTTAVDRGWITDNPCVSLDGTILAGGTLPPSLSGLAYISNPNINFTTKQHSGGVIKGGSGGGGGSSSSPSSSAPVTFIVTATEPFSDLICPGTTYYRGSSDYSGYLFSQTNNTCWMDGNTLKSNTLVDTVGGEQSWPGLRADSINYWLTDKTGYSAKLVQGYISQSLTGVMGGGSGIGNFASKESWAIQLADTYWNGDSATVFRTTDCVEMNTSSLPHSNCFRLFFTESGLDNKSSSRGTTVQVNQKQISPGEYGYIKDTKSLPYGNTEYVPIHLKSTTTVTGYHYDQDTLNCTSYQQPLYQYEHCTGYLPESVSTLYNSGSRVKGYLNGVSWKKDPCYSSSTSDNCDMHYFLSTGATCVDGSTVEDDTQEVTLYGNTTLNRVLEYGGILYGPSGSLYVQINGKYYSYALVDSSTKFSGPLYITCNQESGTSYPCGEARYALKLSGTTTAKIYSSESSSCNDSPCSAPSQTKAYTDISTTVVVSTAKSSDWHNRKVYVKL